MGYMVHEDKLPRVAGYGTPKYATNPDDRKSVSRKIVLLRRTPYTYGTTRQTVLASSAEATTRPSKTSTTAATSSHAAS
jgi:hypothetical protein